MARTWGKLAVEWNGRGAMWYRIEALGLLVGALLGTTIFAIGRLVSPMAWILVACLWGLAVDFGLRIYHDRLDWRLGHSVMAIRGMWVMLVVVVVFVAFHIFATWSIWESIPKWQELTSHMLL